MEQQSILFGFVWSDSVVKAVDALPGCMLGAIGRLLLFSQSRKMALRNRHNLVSHQYQQSS